MSFSVKASDTTSPCQSPGLHPTYVSPHLLPHAGHPFMLPDEGAGVNGKRSGIDPTKFKTTICRNWESGSCTFRGCTFAHGVDELRAPMRDLPPHNSQHVSPSGTPLMLPQAAPPVPLPSGAPRLEQLVDMLMTEVAKQRELLTTHIEANRTLEGMLLKEQQLHRETLGRLEEARGAYFQLYSSVQARQTELREWTNTNGDRVSADVLDQLGDVSDDLNLLPANFNVSDMEDSQRNLAPGLEELLRELEPSNN